MNTFDNTTEAADRLAAMRDRADKFESVAADTAAKLQASNMALGDALTALENANAALKYAADYLRAFNLPVPLDHVLSASKFSENAIAKAKGDLNL